MKQSTEAGQTLGITYLSTILFVIIFSTEGVLYKEHDDKVAYDFHVIHPMASGIGASTR